MDLQNIKNKFGIIGNDPKLNYALEVAEQVAATDLSVLIYGESGVGKEVFSQIIHNLSLRKHSPFIAVNCGAIPEGTIDSELFGHEKGSFTSATDQRKGYFETVNGGTIFLDEIGEMPLGTQARLLRVLETGEYIRVGSSKVLKTNVRVIAATNKDLLELHKKDKFREDLYYRLNTVPIRVPALRERPDDIILLFRKFAYDFAEKYRSEAVQLDEQAQQLLKSYRFPGNVRELKNLTEQISVLSKSKKISAAQLANFLPQNFNNDRMPVLSGQAAQTPIYNYGANESAQSGSSTTEREILYKFIVDLKKDINELKALNFEMAHSLGIQPSRAFSTNDIPVNFQHNNFPEPALNTPINTESNIGNTSFVIHKPGEKINLHEDVEESLSLADREKEFITKALQKHKGKRKDAAQELGISERTLYRKIKEYDLDE